MFIYSYPVPVNSVTFEGGGIGGSEPTEVIAFDASGNILGLCDATASLNGAAANPCASMLPADLPNFFFYQITVNAPGISYAEVGWDDTLTTNLNLDPPAVPEPITAGLMLLGIALLARRYNPLHTLHRPHRTQTQ